MSIRARFFSILLFSALAWPSHSAVSTNDRGELLARASLANELLYSDLQNFVCNERIDRYRGPLSGVGGHRIDTVTSKVSFEDGTERYTDIRQNDTMRPSLASLYGAWSEGEFGTLLRQTQKLLESQTALSREQAQLNGASAIRYRLDISGQDSPWDLEVESKHYRIPFRTDVWVSQISGQILRIERTSTGIPSEVGISEIRWNVSLGDVNLNGKNWLLPTRGEYSVSYGPAQRREWNVLSFSGYRRYGSEATLSFERK